jgi:hypothetical protein
MLVWICQRYFLLRFPPEKHKKHIQLANLNFKTVSVSSFGSPVRLWICGHIRTECELRFPGQENQCRHSEPKNWNSPTVMATIPRRCAAKSRCDVVRRQEFQLAGAIAAAQGRAKLSATGALFHANWGEMSGPSHVNFLGIISPGEKAVLVTWRPIEPPFPSPNVPACPSLATAFPFLSTWRLGLSQ